MFEELEAAIEGLELGDDTDALAVVLSLRGRLDARIAVAVAAVDAAGSWEADGATSTVAWLADRGGLTRRQAGRTARRARLTARLPHTHAAWADGALTSGQVEAVCANLDHELVDLFARHEAAVLPRLVDLSPADVGAGMHTWHELADDRPPRPEPPQRLHASRLLDGQLAMQGTLNGETGELLLTALRLAQTDDVEGEPVRTVATRRADALGDVCRFFLDHQQTRRGGRHRPHINVVLDVDEHGDLAHAHTAGDTPVDGITAGRLLCDSVLHRVLTRGRSAIVDYGHGTRTIAAATWNVLLVRDRHCRFPGCDRLAEWCEAHHVQAWQDGGPTCPSNLVLTCSRHHHLLHTPGWHARLLPDATFEVTDPRDRVRVTRAPLANGPPEPSPAPLAG